MAQHNPFSFRGVELALGTVPRRLGVILSSPHHHYALSDRRAADEGVRDALDAIGVDTGNVPLTFARVLRPKA